MNFYNITIKLLFVFTILFTIGSFSACDENDEKSGDNSIIAFSFDGLAYPVQGVISEGTQTIELTVPYGQSLTSLVPTIIIADKAIISPASGVAQDFTTEVQYSVTAENGQIKVYTVIVTSALSDEKEILSFAFNGFNSEIEGEINENNEIRLTVPYSANLTSLVASFTTTASSIRVGQTTQVSGETPNDFTSNVIYTAVAADGTTKDYTIIVEKTEANSENSIISYDFAVICDYKGKNDTVKYVNSNIDENAGIIELSVPFGTDLSKMLPAIEISDYATIEPQSFTDTNFSSGQVVYTVTAENGEAKEYTVLVKEEEQPEAVRGFWLTNVGSWVLNYGHLTTEMVELADELGFNTICIVVWNKARTMYPSQIMKDLIGIEQDESFVGRDPLAKVIEEAHKKDMKVIAWFEYGFASIYGDEANDVILKTKPDWASRDVNGNVVSKNGFRWMNGFLPEVQDFMLSLMLEVINNYDIDGIQGDDRLPSMPSESGYDDYTVNLYKEQHDGQEPPTNPKDGDWIDWRVKLMNEYQAKIYSSVKEADPNCVVSMAPHPYSYGRVDYLQDWRDWVKEGTVDMVHPQLYRYESDGLYQYRTILGSASYAAAENIDKLYPGVLLYLGSYSPTNQYLADVINLNRAKNVKGEIFFFYEGLKDHKELFKALYPVKAKFPEF